jgi:hypothetical protein
LRSALAAKEVERDGLARDIGELQQRHVTVVAGYLASHSQSSQSSPPQPRSPSLLPAADLNSKTPSSAVKTTKGKGTKTRQAIYTPPPPPLPPPTSASKAVQTIGAPNIAFGTPTLPAPATSPLASPTKTTRRGRGIARSLPGTPSRLQVERAVAAAAASVEDPTQRDARRGATPAPDWPVGARSSIFSQSAAADDLAGAKRDATEVGDTRRHVASLASYLGDPCKTTSPGLGVYGWGSGLLFYDSCFVA